MEVYLNTGISGCVSLLKLTAQQRFGTNRNLFTVYRLALLVWVQLYTFTMFLGMLKADGEWEQKLAIFFDFCDTLKSTLKVALFYRHDALLETVLATVKIESFRPRTEKEAEIVTRENSKCVRIFNCFCAYVFVSAIAYFAEPLLERGAKRLLTVAWLPYDCSGGASYALTYLWQCGAVIQLYVSNVAMDILFALLMVQARAQTEVLIERLTNVGRNGEGQLRSCIRHHKTILRFVRDTEAVFKWTNTIQIPSTAFILVSMLFAMSQFDRPLAALIKLVAHLVAILLEQILFCWYANELTAKSDEISYSAFASEWYECSEEAKKELGFFMHRTQRPVTLYVGNIVPVSLATLTAIIRSAWAYFMCIRNVQMASKD